MIFKQYPIEPTFLTFYYSDNFFLNQAFLTKSIDLLLYMSIIISKEREITKVIQGMKEMKEIKTCYIHKDMLRESLDVCFWEVMNARMYFQDELMFTDFMDYALDMAGDSTDLSILINKTNDKFVHPYIARKISLYYNSVQDLMFDIKSYLLNNYDIDYNKELEIRKAKRNAKRNSKKEGK